MGLECGQNVRLIWLTNRWLQLYVHKDFDAYVFYSLCEINLNKRLKKKISQGCQKSQSHQSQLRAQEVAANLGSS